MIKTKIQFANRWLLLLVTAVLMALPMATAHATATTLFEDATTEVETMGGQYKTFLKAAFIAVVVVGLVFMLVKRGSKKAVGGG